MSIHIFLPRSQLRESAANGRLPAPTDSHDLRARILIVDDDAVRQVTADILRGLRYQVVEAGSVGAAFDILDSEPVDLLLLDFAMPGMSGAEVARRARALSTHAHSVRDRLRRPGSA